MKSSHLNMYKKINYIAAVLILLASISAKAQITTQSPYSRYGLGNIKGSMLPQYRAMGGISTAINKPTLYSNINMQNPASYTGISLTTLDIGMSGAFTTLERNGAQEKSYNSTLSHLALAFPLVTGKSAISFGILPYTELGYEYSVAAKLDTTNVNYRYAGEGGLTKAYIGFGQRIGENFSIGGNIEYLFGNLQESRATELLTYPSIPNRQQNKNSVGGVTFSYGMQYQIPLGNKKSLTLGYSGSASSSVNSKKTYLVTQYNFDDLGEEAAAFDTLEIRENPSAKLKLPLTHNFGIAFQKDNKWLIGADYRMGKWSKLSIEGVNQACRTLWFFCRRAVHPI
jgi:long-subunit fatty acid transport protein